MKKSLPLIAVVLLAFTLMPSQSFGQVEHDNGGLLAWLNDYGRIRVYHPGADLDVDGTQIERISVLVGGAENEVFDYQMDADNESPAEVVANPALSDWELFVSTNNAYSNLPPNYLVDMSIFGWVESPYFLLKYTVTNNEAESMDAYLGAEVIPSLDQTYGGEVVTYDAANNSVLFTRDGSPYAAGVMPLSHDFVTLQSIDWYDSYYESDTDYWNWLTAGTVEETFDQSPNGPVTFMGLGTTTLAPGESTSYWFAFALAATADAVNDWLTDAAARFATITAVEQIEAVPTEYRLSQNYPNPFNPATKINFSIPQSEYVSLKVYNAIGQEVANLVNKELNAGSYSVDFNAENLSSGIYMYTISAGSFSITKKMMLVK